MCGIDGIEDQRLPEQRLPALEPAGELALDDIIACLSAAITATEEHRERVLEEIDSSFDFMQEKLTERESALQGSVMTAVHEQVSEVLAYRVPNNPLHSMNLQSPLLYSYFPKVGDVGPWNRIEYTDCSEFNNVTYLLKPQCCRKLYCCYKCHDNRENHKWKNALETVCLFCDTLQKYKQLPNICASCKGYHSAMNNKTK